MSRRAPTPRRCTLRENTSTRRRGQPRWRRRDHDRITTSVPCSDAFQGRSGDGSQGASRQRGRLSSSVIAPCAFVQLTPVVSQPARPSGLSACIGFVSGTMTTVSSSHSCRSGCVLIEPVAFDRMRARIGVRHLHPQRRLDVGRAQVDCNRVRRGCGSGSATSPRSSRRDERSDQAPRAWWCRRRRVSTPAGTGRYRSHGGLLESSLPIVPAVLFIFAR